MTLLTVADAAELLGVSVRQVQHLAERGKLRQVARGLLDGRSVERLVAARGGSHTRAWSEETAWGAVALLTGVDPEWMGASQRSRLRTRLRGLDAAALGASARNRANVTRYAAHHQTGRYLTTELVSNDAAARLGLAATSTVDGYLDRAAVGDVVSRHGLIPDDDGHVTLRATSMDLSVVRELAQRSVTLAALDLVESLDSREHRAGLIALEQALESFRG